MRCVVYKRSDFSRWLENESHISVNDSVSTQIRTRSQVRRRTTLKKLENFKCSELILWRV